MKRINNQLAANNNLATIKQNFTQQNFYYQRGGCRVIIRIEKDKK